MRVSDMCLLMPEVSVAAVKNWVKTERIGNKPGQGKAKFLLMEEAFKLWMIYCLREDKLPMETIQEFLKLYEGDRKANTFIARYTTYRVNLNQMKIDFKKACVLNNIVIKGESFDNC